MNSHDPAKIHRMSQHRRSVSNRQYGNAGDIDDDLRSNFSGLTMVSERPHQVAPPRPVLEIRGTDIMSQRDRETREERQARKDRERYNQTLVARENARLDEEADCSRRRHDTSRSGQDGLEEESFLGDDAYYDSRSPDGRIIPTGSLHDPEQRRRQYGPGDDYPGAPSDRSAIASTP